MDNQIGELESLIDINIFILIFNGILSYMY